MTSTEISRPEDPEDENPKLSAPHFEEAPPLRLRFVLLHPHTPENLGAAARALKNFGFRDWAMVNSRSSMDLDKAKRLAVHAADLMDNLKHFQTLDEAVKGCVFVTGTSSRHVQGREFLTPEEWADKAAKLVGVQREDRHHLKNASSNLSENFENFSATSVSHPTDTMAPAAIVFGEERSGMSNSEIQRCHALSGIPTLPEQPSLNLAQAILLYAYEARKASILAFRQNQLTGSQPALATDEALGRIQTLVRQVLTKAKFLSPIGERTAIRDLMSPLFRAAPCIREARLLEAALHTVLKFLSDK